MSDPVNHPSYYAAGGIECIDAITEACKELVGVEAFCTANAIKYLWRWKKKGGVQDLEKAKWYIDRVIQHNTPPPLPKVTKPDAPNALGKEWAAYGQEFQKTRT